MFAFCILPSTAQQKECTRERESKWSVVMDSCIRANGLVLDNSMDIEVSPLLHLDWTMANITTRVIWKIDEDT